MDAVIERFSRTQWSASDLAALLTPDLLTELSKLWPTLDEGSPLRPRILLALLCLPQPSSPDLMAGSRTLLSQVLEDARVADGSTWAGVVAGLLASYAPVTYGEGDQLPLAKAVLEVSVGPITTAIRDARSAAGASTIDLSAIGALGAKALQHVSRTLENVELRDLPYEARLLGSLPTSSSDASGHCEVASTSAVVTPSVTGGPAPPASPAPGALAARRREAVQQARQALLSHEFLSQVGQAHAQVREQAQAAAEAGMEAPDMQATLASLPPEPSAEALSACESSLASAGEDLLAYLLGLPQGAKPLLGAAAAHATGTAGGIGGVASAPVRGLSRPGAALSPSTAAALSGGRSFKRQREAPQAIDAHADELRTKVARVEAGGARDTLSAAEKMEKLRRQLEDAPLLSPDQRAAVLAFIEGAAETGLPASVTLDAGECSGGAAIAENFASSHLVLMRFTTLPRTALLTPSNLGCSWPVTGPIARIQCKQARCARDQGHRYVGDHVGHPCMENGLEESCLNARACNQSRSE